MQHLNLFDSSSLVSLRSRHSRKRGQEEANNFVWGYGERERRIGSSKVSNRDLLTIIGTLTVLSDLNLSI